MLQRRFVLCLADTPLYRLRLRRQDLMCSALAPSTIRMRQVQWRCYLRCCTVFKFNPIPCSDEQLSLFASYISQYMTYTSVSNYLQSVIWNHKLLNITPPTVSSDIVQMTLAGIKRRSKPPRRKDPITIRQLLLIFTHLDMSRTVNVMFWACLLVLFRSLLRVSHVVTSDHTLVKNDVIFLSDGGVILKIRSNKTTRPGDTHFIPISPLLNKKLCAVYWLKKWFSLCHRPMHQPLFSLNSSPMSYGSFSSAFRTLVRVSGIEANLSSHSFRRGGATFLSSVGVPISNIKERGHWTSDAVYKYISPSIGFKAALDRKVSRIIDVMYH